MAKNGYFGVLHAEAQVCGEPELYVFLYSRRVTLTEPKPMKTRQPETDTELLPEYDLRGKKGVRGKYYRAYQQGHTVRIHEADGSTSTQFFTLEDGAVLLAPDVREYFPDSESVNQALRGLIDLIPHKQAHHKSHKLAKSAAD